MPRCDHRYKLVGYRDETGTSIQWAVLVCLRCTHEFTTRVDTLPVPEYIQKKEGESEGS